MANRYWVGGTANWDGTAGTKWSDTSGGAGGFSVPTAADDVYLDGASGAVTITVTAAATARGLICIGFTGTLAGSSAITVYSSGVTLDSGMTITHTGTLSAAASGTWISNGKQWTGNGSIVGVFTVTYLDDWSFVGNWSQTSTSTLLGGTNISVGGNLSINALGGSSNITFILNGTGNWSVSADASQVDYIINTSGTITLSGALGFAGSGKVFTYITGTVITTGSSMTISGNATIDLDGIVFNNFFITGAGTHTLLSDLHVNGNSVLGSLGQVLTINGLFNIYVGGNLTIGGTSSVVQGTTSIILNGTGVFSSTQTTGTFRLNLTFNTVGIITISGTIRYRTGTITYTSGTIITTSSTLNITSTTTLDTAGITWNNVTCSASQILTINSLLSINNTLTYNLGTVITCAGTAGWTTSNFYILTSNNINHELVAGITYTVNNYFESISTTSLLKDSLISSIPGTKAIFTLAYGATQNVGYTNATDIDSSLGQTIWTFNGVVTTTLNWNSFNSTIGSNKNYIF